MLGTGSSRLDFVYVTGRDLRPTAVGLSTLGCYE